ncbi:DSBA oxidoreductase [Burkholderia aenigmatica]|uniref:DsbA family oxidoreductase n=1 Tax=Burkholderia cepacia complex TaxID=87882 RepID=UPI000F099ACA|nr:MULTISPECIES: DsbA family oxidoreductase [Burkholderia cepacia complex]AYQ40874.1 DsbA family oxidoreductase [Burkholderia lata]VWC61714.1 DSBA oxidoreductase [Burkholderia aenigmatica]
MKIDIWSDVICPFCYIGKRKLEAALEQTGIAAQIEWHSFELNPSAPRSYAMPLPDVMNRLYGIDRQRALAILNHEEQEARSMGLDFQWRIARPGNTFDAHRLIHLARHEGIGGQVKERFLRAYFTEGQDIGDRQVLRALALGTGLPADDVDAVLGSDRFADEVRADEQQAVELGIRGVPYFVINGQASVSGARDVADFVRVLREQAAIAAAATQETGPAPASDDAGICKDGFCEVRK